jgi:hypothetical protein
MIGVLVSLLIEINHLFLDALPFPFLSFLVIPMQVWKLNSQIDCVNPVPKLANRPFRSSNLFIYVISVSKLTNYSFRSSNLFDCVILVPKLANHPFRSSNLFSCVISAPKCFKYENSIYIYRIVQKL